MAKSLAASRASVPVDDLVYCDGLNGGTVTWTGSFDQDTYSYSVTGVFDACRCELHIARVFTKLVQMFPHIARVFTRVHYGAASPTPAFAEAATRRQA